MMNTDVQQNSIAEARMFLSSVTKQGNRSKWIAALPVKIATLIADL